MSHIFLCLQIGCLRINVWPWCKCVLLSVSVCVSEWVSERARASVSEWGSEWASVSERVSDSEGVSERVWVSEWAIVSERARVSEGEWVSERARVSEGESVREWERVSEGEWVSEGERVSGREWVRERVSWSIMTELCVKWSCEYCTYENWPSAIKCTMCRAQRPSGTIITEELFPSGAGHRSDPVCKRQPAHLPRFQRQTPGPPGRVLQHNGKWSCQVCTYQNWPRAIRCTQCHGVRSHSTETPQTSGTGPPADPCEEYNDRNRLNTRAQCWTCSACSYENWPKSSGCVVCDHPRPDQPDKPRSVINERDRGGARRHSPSSSKREAELQIELAAGAQSGKEEIEMDFKKLKQIKNRMRKTDWLFLNACAGECLVRLHSLKVSLYT